MSVQKPENKIPLQFKDVSFKCKHCDASFSIQSKLEKHHALAHPKLCPICGLDFSREGKKQHQKRFHSEVMLKCPSCKNSYLGQTLFLEHAKKCQKSCGPGEKPAVSIQALSPRKTQVVNSKTSKSQVISNQKTVKTAKGGKAELFNISPIHGNGNKVLSVDGGEFKKQIGSMMKPVQTSTPKLPNKVIVMDVADLRKNFSNVVQPFPSSKPTAQLGTVSSKPHASFQGQLSSKMPDLISAAKPMELVKTSSSKSQPESGKKVLQVDDLEFRRVIKDFLPPAATEINQSAPATRKSTRNCTKRKPDNLVSAPPKRLKKVDEKISVQTPRDSTKRVSFSEVVEISVVDPAVSLSKLSQKGQISVTLTAKNLLAKKDCGMKPATGTEISQPIQPAKINLLKEARVVLPRLPADVVKQCLQDGFFRVKPKQPPQKTIYVEVTKQVMQKIKSNLLPKDSFQKVGADGPIQIVLPQKVVGSLQSKTNIENLKKVQSPATGVQPVFSKETTASSYTRKVEIPPPKVCNNLAPTILQWKEQMERDNARSTPAPQAVQSNQMKAVPLPSVSSTTFKSSVEKESSKPTVIPQAVKSSQKNVVQVSSDCPSTLKSTLEKQPSKPIVALQTVKSSQGKVVLLSSDSPSTLKSPFEKEPSVELTVTPLPVQSNQKKVVLLSPHSPSTFKSPSKPTVALQTLKSNQEKVVLLSSNSWTIKKSPEKKGVLQPSNSATTMKPLTTSPIVVVLSDNDSVEGSPRKNKKIEKASAQKSALKKPPQAVKSQPSSFSTLIKSAVDKEYNLKPSVAPQTAKQNRKKQVPTLSTSSKTTESPIVVLLSDTDSPEESSPCPHPKSKTQSKATKKKPDAPPPFVKPQVEKPKEIVLDEKEVILKKMLHKIDEKERLKKEKYIAKKTTKFVEKKLEQLKKLQEQLSKTKSPSGADQRRLMRDVSHLLFSFNKQEVSKVFLHFGLEVLLKHIEGKHVQNVYKTGIAANQVLSNSYKRYSAAPVNSPNKVTTSVALTRIEDPCIDMKMVTGDKFLLECPCKKPNCDH